MNRTITPALHRVLSIGALALLTAATAMAGPLTPPAGPVVPTGKTLTEVEPRIAISLTNTPGDTDSLFKITQPGSYYLTGNIAGIVGKSGIEIAAANVTVDLMGHDVRGIAGALRGIVTSGSGVTSIVVRNGSVGGWPTGGVLFGGNGVFVCKDLRVSSNTGNGISMDTGQIEGCSAFANTGAGLKMGQGGTITRCFASGNGGIGIDAGIIATVTDCSASSNGGNGIVLAGNGVASRCTSQQNTGAGFFADFASLVESCASRGNTGVGIDARAAVTVRNCSVDGNTLDGILAQARCLIIGNSLSANGNATSIGSGIRVTGADNRIQGNNCTINDHGIRVEAAGNIILSNSCSGNTTTNYELVANNVCGPIIDRTVPASAAVSGNSAPDSSGSTHPNANFAY